MSENTFDSQEINLQFQPLPAFIDTDGSFKLNTPMLSSFDFDGSIPKRDEPVDAIEVKPGYLIQIESGGEYFPVVSVEYDELDIEDTGIVTINYIDDQGNTISADYDETDQISAVYEDWDEKVLGSQGWGITAGGNAIFTNVAVRGDLEATTLNVGGDDGITYDGTEVIIGASVSILGSLTIGDVEDYLDENNYATDTDLAGYIPDGYAASDIISNGTTITGANIFTGTIQSQNYSYTSGNFSNYGMRIGLDGNGYIRSPGFYFDTSGNAYFKGDISAATGTFTGDLSGADISGGTITGSRIQTRTGTSYIRIDDDVSLPYGTADAIEFYMNSDSKAVLSYRVGVANFLGIYSDNIQLYQRYGGFNCQFGVSGTLEVSNGARIYNTTTLDTANATTLDASSTLNASSISGNRAFRVGSSGAVYSYGIDGNTTTNAANVRVGSSAQLLKSTSSQRWKTDIIPIINDLQGVEPEKISSSNYSLDCYDVLSISPVEFMSTASADSNERMIGFIAEDVAAKFPWAAGWDEDGVPNEVKDRPIIAALIVIINDQKEIIDDLQNRVLQLETQLGG